VASVHEHAASFCLSHRCVPQRPLACKRDDGTRPTHVLPPRILLALCGFRFVSYPRPCVQRGDDLMLIDFEYSDWNARGFDIANHFMEFVCDRRLVAWRSVELV